MNAYTKIMNFLHQKLLQARNRADEDRIVDFMLAESKRNRQTQASNKDTEKIK